MAVCFDLDDDGFLPLVSIRDEALVRKFCFFCTLELYLGGACLVADDLRVFLAETEALRDDDLLVGSLINSLRACFLAARSWPCFTLL